MGKSRYLAATIIALTFSILTTVDAKTTSLTLQWNENSESDLATGDHPIYKIYYKTDSSGFGEKVNFIGYPSSEPAMADEGVSPVAVTMEMDENPDPGLFEFTLYNLDDTYVYYIAVTALDNSASTKSGSGAPPVSAAASGVSSGGCFISAIFR